MDISRGAYMDADDGNTYWVEPMQKATQTVTVRPSRRKTQTGVVAVKPHVATRKKAAPKAAAKPRAKNEQEVTEGGRILRIPLKHIQPDPKQHRKLFKDAETQELIRSIENSGQKTPISVRPVEGAGINRGVKYQIIGGERRWRAMTALAKKDPERFGKIKAEIRYGLTDEEVLTEQVIENLNRVQVTPMEEAVAYRQLYDLEFGKAKRRKGWAAKLANPDDPRALTRLEDATRAWVAKQTGKTQHHTTWYMQLTDLPDNVQEMVSRGSLNPKQAHALLRLTAAYDNRDDLTAEEKAVLKERRVHQGRMARHTAANSLGTDKLGKLISAYLKVHDQGTMFEGSEITGGAKQERRQAQKSRLQKVLTAVVDAVTSVWSDKKQEFSVDAFNEQDLRVALDQIDGAMASFGQMREVVEQAMLRKEMQEATKRRVVTLDEATGNIQQAGRSLFASVSRAVRGIPVLQKGRVRGHTRRSGSTRVVVGAHRRKDSSRGATGDKWAKPYTGNREPVLDTYQGRAEFQSEPDSPRWADGFAERYTRREGETTIFKDRPQGDELPLMVRTFRHKSKPSEYGWHVMSAENEHAAYIRGTLRAGGVELGACQWQDTKGSEGDVGWGRLDERTAPYSTLTKILQWLTMQHDEAYSPPELSRDEATAWQAAAAGHPNIKLDKVIGKYKSKEYVRYRLSYTQPTMFDVEQVPTNEDFNKPEGQPALFGIGKLLGLLKGRVRGHTRRSGSTRVVVGAHSRKDAGRGGSIPGDTKPHLHMRIREAPRNQRRPDLYAKKFAKKYPNVARVDGDGFSVPMVMGATEAKDTHPMTVQTYETLAGKQLGPQTGLHGFMPDGPDLAFVEHIVVGDIPVVTNATWASDTVQPAILTRLLRKLVGRHGAVKSGSAMSKAENAAWLAATSKGVVLEKELDGDDVTYTLRQEFAAPSKRNPTGQQALFSLKRILGIGKGGSGMKIIDAVQKARVKGHTRKTKSGRAQVKEHTRNTGRKFERVVGRQKLMDKKDAAYSQVFAIAEGDWITVYADADRDRWVAEDAGGDICGHSAYDLVETAVHDAAAGDVIEVATRVQGWIDAALASSSRWQKLSRGKKVKKGLAGIMQALNSDARTTKHGDTSLQVPREGPRA